jgi:hypothetical protein
MFLDVLIESAETYEDGTKLQFTEVLDSLSLSYKISQEIVKEMAQLEE